MVTGKSACSASAQHGRVRRIGATLDRTGRCTGSVARGIDRVQVVTQGRNVRAQRVYQRCGFVSAQLQLWYHRWFTTIEVICNHDARIQIPFNKPAMMGNELEYIADAVRSGKISGDATYSKKCHALLEDAARRAESAADALLHARAGNVGAAARICSPATR